MNWTSEEAKRFVQQLKQKLKDDEKILISEGWRKKEGVTWVSPKGEEYSHDAGLFGDHRRAIEVCINDKVLETFVQFEIRVWNDEENPKNRRGTDEPYDWFFPCIRDGKLYWYDEAVDLAFGRPLVEHDNIRWDNLKKLIEDNFNLVEIKQGQVIEVFEEFEITDKGDMWVFRLFTENEQ